MTVVRPLMPTDAVSVGWGHDSTYAAESIRAIRDCISIVFGCSLSFAAPPAAYYAPAGELQGQALKAVLHDLFSTMKSYRIPQLAMTFVMPSTNLTRIQTAKIQCD